MGMLAGGFFTFLGSGGDVIDLQNMSAGKADVGGSFCECRLYNVGLNDGEQWFEDGGWTYQNDTITPVSNVNLYQMKWDLLSGDAPTGANTSSAEGVWFALSGGDFRIEWFVAGGNNEETGIVTVSIRLGSGPSVLATALWDGECISTKT